MTLPTRTLDQERGIKFLRSHPRAMLADEQGKGKTRQLLEAAEEPALVVCPAYALPVWEDEHAKWTPDLDLSVVSYSSICKRVADDRGNLTIATTAPLRELKQDWATLIADESHYLKGRKTNWTKAFFGLAKYSARIWLATGTPIPNWAHELWTSIRLINPTEFNNSYWRWVGHWFVTWEPRWGGTRIEDLKEEWSWEQFQEENFGDNYLRREWSDSDFPFSETSIPCPMVPSQKKVYNELKKNYRVELEAGTIEAWSDGGLAAKLHKVSTGLEVELEGVKGSGKLKTLRELLKDRTPPLVIFAWYRPTVKAIAEVVKEVGYSYGVRSGSGSSPSAVKAYRDFQRGKIDVLIGTLATTSESLNLPRASTCIFVERSWRPSTNKQAIGRLRRLGQENPICVLHLVTEGVDRNMLKVLKKKTDQQSRAIKPREFWDML